MRHTTLVGFAFLCFVLSSAGAEGSSGPWTLLFDGQSTAGWRGYGKPAFPAKGWTVEEGWLTRSAAGGGDIITEAQFEEFELEWEWKLESGGNSGVKYFVQESRPSAPGHEYQLLDDQRHPDAKLGDGKRVTASFYDVIAPQTKTNVRPPGETNSSRILVRGNRVEHWLNGERVLAYECGSDALKSALAKSKFKNSPGFGTRSRGQILLQDHGNKVWFRNIRIRTLPPTDR